jgi:HPr kinase/phosphorylase
MGLSNSPTHFHGVFVEIFGRGVLLTGQSGIGKSEAALALLDRGNYFISDDIVLFKLSSCGKKAVGSCPSVKFKGFLEVRGLGILNVETLFGATKIKSEATLDLICQLLAVSSTEIDRSERTETQEKILDLSIPKVMLPVFPGRNMALLVETAVRTQQ